jgi:hypothetical protein
VTVRPVRSANSEDKSPLTKQCAIRRQERVARIIDTGHFRGRAVQLDDLEIAPLLELLLASIDYGLDEGSVADEVCYGRDMTLLPHLLNLLFKREIQANYSFSPAAIRAGNRKEISRELRDEIVAMRS